MAILKCKMCGGDLDISEGVSVCECEYCGTRQTVPTADNEKKMTLFARANRLRAANEFDKASGIYESIAAEFPEEAEAYWGLVLCKYGIEYVDDPATGKKVPTCHRSSFDSVMEDVDFEQACENADGMARRQYREEAKQIEEIRKGIIEVSDKEAPYDIFICYKETDESGDRTIDSVIAQDVYDALTSKGYRVFFSRISLEDKLGTEYEPYIFAALNSAKVMLAFGTDFEYYNAVWVKNEWSRFLKLMEKDKTKHLIPCYKDIDAYDMPKEFRRLQAQDMGKVGAIQDLARGIGKIVSPKTSAVDALSRQAGSAEGSALTLRGKFALEDGDYNGAEGYFERALDINPSDARAYFGKFLALLQVSSLADLNDKVLLLDNIKEFRRAEQFADASLAKELMTFRNNNEMKIQRLRMIDVIKRITEKKKDKEVQLAKEEAQKREEEQRRRKEEELRRQEEERLNKEKEEEDRLRRELEIRNEEKRKKQIELDKIQKQMKSDIADLENEINDKRKTLNGLGFFKGKEKKAIQNQIDELYDRLRSTRKEYEEKICSIKLRIAEIGDIVLFGHYQQGQGMDPIEWFVLDIKNNTILLISKYVLEYKQYYEKNYGDVTWETSPLRYWLNNEFLKSAFNKEENAVIQIQTVTADINPKSAANPGRETNDKVFLLSTTEAENYLQTKEIARGIPTTYTKSTDQYVKLLNQMRDLDRKFGGSSGTVFRENCSYWLRTPGEDNRKVAVISFGEVYYKGRQASEALGVRPVVQIDLTMISEK